MEVAGHPLTARDGIEARTLARDLAWASLYDLAPEKSKLWLLTRTRARRDLLWFSRNLLGLDRLSESVHRPAADFVMSVIRTPHGFGNLRDPRGNGKTSLSTRSSPLWCATQDPIECAARGWPHRGRESRFGIVTLKMEFTWDLMQLLLDDLASPMLKWAFPELVPPTPKKWSRRAIELNRGLPEALRTHPLFAEYPPLTRFPDPTFSAGSLEAGRAGAHTHGEFIDDPVNEDTWDSESNIRTAVHAIRQLYNVTRPEQGFRLVTGNFWAPGDVADTIDLEDGNWRVFMRSATACKQCRDGYPVDSRGIPPRTRAGQHEHTHSEPTFTHLMLEANGAEPNLARIAASCGSKHIFMAQYENNPLAAASTMWSAREMPSFAIGPMNGKPLLDTTCTVTYPTPEGGSMTSKLRDLDITITFDPAHGSTAIDASENAIVSFARTPVDSILWLETWAEKLDEPLAALETLLDTIRRYRPRKVGIESVGYQRVLVGLLERELLARKMTWFNTERDILPIIRTKAEGAKESYIRDSLGPLITSRALHLSPQAAGYDRTILAIDRFPLWKRLDILDAASMQPHLWQGGPPRSASERGRRKRMIKLRRREFARKSGSTGYGWRVMVGEEHILEKAFGCVLRRIF